MIAKNPRIAALSLGLACGLTACAADDGEKIVPAPELASGKADATLGLDRRETIELGGEAKGEFTEDLEFHGYTVAVGQDSQVKIEIARKGSSSKLDTTLFVFGPNKGLGGFGDEALFTDDDSGWGALSRLDDVTLEDAGQYLIVVGTVPGEKSRGHYRLTVECTGESCTDVDETVLDTCDDGFQELIDECIFELTFDTQDSDFAIRECVADEAFENYFEINCEALGVFVDPQICVGGFEKFTQTMMPVCQEDAFGLIPQSELDLTRVFSIPTELDDVMHRIGDECFDFCQVDLDAWTYEGDDPTAVDAVEAVRGSIDSGAMFANRGEVSLAEARDIFPHFDAFAEAAKELGEGEVSTMGLTAFSAVVAPSVDAFANRIVLVYPENKTLVSLEVTFFSE